MQALPWQRGCAAAVGRAAAPTARGGRCGSLLRGPCAAEHLSISLLRAPLLRMHALLTHLPYSIQQHGLDLSLHSTTCSWPSRAGLMSDSPWGVDDEGGAQALGELEVEGRAGAGDHPECLPGGIAHAEPAYVHNADRAPCARTWRAHAHTHTRAQIS